MLQAHRETVENGMKYKGRLRNLLLTKKIHADGL